MSCLVPAGEPLTPQPAERVGDDEPPPPPDPAAPGPPALPPALLTPPEPPPGFPPEATPPSEAFAPPAPTEPPAADAPPVEVPPLPEPFVPVEDPQAMAVQASDTNRSPGERIDFSASSRRDGRAIPSLIGPLRLPWGMQRFLCRRPPPRGCSLPAQPQESCRPCSMHRSDP